MAMKNNDSYCQDKASKMLNIAEVRALLNKTEIDDEVVINSALLAKRAEQDNHIINHDPRSFDLDWQIEQGKQMDFLPDGGYGYRKISPINDLNNRSYFISVTEETGGGTPWGWSYDPVVVIGGVIPSEGYRFSYVTQKLGKHTMLLIRVFALSNSSITLRVDQVMPRHNLDGLGVNSDPFNIEINTITTFAQRSWDDAGAEYRIGYWETMENFQQYIQEHDDKCPNCGGALLF